MWPKLTILLIFMGSWIQNVSNTNDNIRGVRVPNAKKYNASKEKYYIFLKQKNLCISWGIRPFAANHLQRPGTRFLLDNSTYWSINFIVKRIVNGIWEWFLLWNLPHPSYVLYFLWNTETNTVKHWILERRMYILFKFSKEMHIQHHSCSSPG